MELDFRRFDHIDSYNVFVWAEKQEGRIVIPVSVIVDNINNWHEITVFFYYATS